MNINKAIQEFKSIKHTINPKYRPYADEVISLFKDRKIEKTKEAEKLLMQLSSRGKAPTSAIQKIKREIQQSRNSNRKANPTSNADILYKWSNTDQRNI